MTTSSQSDIDTSSQAVSDWETYYHGIYAAEGGGKVSGASEDYSDAHAAGVSAVPDAIPPADGGVQVGFVLAVVAIAALAFFAGRS